MSRHDGSRSRLLSRRSGIGSPYGRWSRRFLNLWGRLAGLIRGRAIRAALRPLFELTLAVFIGLRRTGGGLVR